MSQSNEQQKTVCEHKFIHLRNLGTEEIGYRQWAQVDMFFCEKCLEQKRVSRKIEEKQSYRGW